MRKDNMMLQAHFRGESFDSDFYRSQKSLFMKFMMEAFNVHLFRALSSKIHHIKEHQVEFYIFPFIKIF